MLCKHGTVWSESGPFFTCSYGCPYDDPVPTRQTHRTAREKPFQQPVLARKNNRHAAAPVPVMHRSKPSLAM